MATERLTERSDIQALTVESSPVVTVAPRDGAWFVLLIEPQQEVRVASYLKSYRLGVYLPLVPHITTRGVRRTKVTVYRPMMRGYLFLDEATLAAGMRHIEGAPAVHKFLQFGERFAIVPNWQMERVRRIEEELAKPKDVQSIFDVGEVVRIDDGPFVGLNATITDLANGKRITVEIPLMRRAVPITLGIEQLEKL